MSTLSRLISPISPELFFSEYWTQKSLFVKGEENKFDAWFSWKIYNRLLNEQISTITFPSLRLANNGEIISENDITELVYSGKKGSYKRISAEKVNSYCQEGATLIVDSVDRKCSELGKLIERLSSDLGEKAQINSYCSWKGTQGFDIHYDTHEVFILQIEGSKEWNIYDNLSTSFPLLNSSKGEVPKDIEPINKLTLTKGDFLYIPRGIWHSAIAIDEPSLHLTIGVSCRTSFDFISWLTAELAEGVQSLRQNIPISNHVLNGSGYSVIDLQKILNEFQLILSSSDKTSSLLERYTSQYLFDYGIDE